MRPGEYWRKSLQVSLYPERPKLQTWHREGDGDWEPRAGDAMAGNKERAGHSGAGGYELI